MKKYTLILVAFLFVFGLFVFNANSAKAFPSGCDSDAGYSSTTGMPCNSTIISGSVSCGDVHYTCVNGSTVNAADGANSWTWSCEDDFGGATTVPCSETKPITNTCLPSGIDSSNGFVCGCDSNTGWSSTNGRSCTGCDSTSGYNLLTGQSCTPPPPVSTCTSMGVDSVTGFICGCSSRTGWSSTAGRSCTGCDSESGYNLLTGQSCTPTQPPVTVCTNGFNPATGFLCGCTSINGYSLVNGLSCNPNPTPTPTPTPAPTCTNGFNSTNGFRCGCISTSGYSSVNGESCGVESFPPGCTSSLGYSIVTGMRCDGVYVPPTSVIYPSGCTSSLGYSTTTGEPCSGNLIPIPIPTPTPTPICAITSILRLDSTGADVSCLQSRIGLISDGKFGPRTQIAVKAFQANAGLKADGIVGPMSVKALEVSN